MQGGDLSDLLASLGQDDPTTFVVQIIEQGEATGFEISYADLHDYNGRLFLTYSQAFSENPQLTVQMLGLPLAPGGKPRITTFRFAKGFVMDMPARPLSWLGRERDVAHLVI